MIVTINYHLLLNTDPRFLTCYYYQLIGNLQVLDPTINRFEKLLTLDLSRNEIVKIVGSLELPHLVSLGS